MKSGRLTLSIVMVLTAGLAAPLSAQQDPTTEQPSTTEEVAVSDESAPADEATPAAGEVAEDAATTPESPGTEFPVTLDFTLTGPIALSGRVGEVEIRSVEFLRGNVKSNMIKGAFSSGNEDLESELTVRLSCATTAEKKWKLDIMVEFLDGDGTVIDRTTDSISTKNEAKIFEFKHKTLAWAVPHIKTARLSITGKQ